MYLQAQCFKNLSAVLEEAGSSMKNVVRVGVFLTDMTNFAAMNKVYSTLRFCFLSNLTRIRYMRPSLRIPSQYVAQRVPDTHLLGWVQMDYTNGPIPVPHVRRCQGASHANGC